MTTRITGAKESLDKTLHDETKPWTTTLSWAEEKTGVKRLYLFVLVLVFLGIYLVFGYAAQVLCNVIAFVYPAYASMKAIESPQKGDDTKWLTYWTVFALFSILEYPSDFLLHWFPFYWLAKCILFIWCFLPMENNGSMIIYNQFIRPYFLKHEHDVDNVLSNVTGTATDYLKKKLIDGAKAE